MSENIIAEIAELRNQVDWLTEVIDRRTEDCTNANARISILEGMIDDLCKNMDWEEIIDRVRRVI